MRKNTVEREEKRRNLFPPFFFFDVFFFFFFCVGFLVVFFFFSALARSNSVALFSSSEDDAAAAAAAAAARKKEERGGTLSFLSLGSTPRHHSRHRHCSVSARAHRLRAESASQSREIGPPIPLQKSSSSRKSSREHGLRPGPDEGRHQAPLRAGVQRLRRLQLCGGCGSRRPDLPGQSRVED